MEEGAGRIRRHRARRHRRHPVSHSLDHPDRKDLQAGKGGKRQEAAHEPFPDDLDQTPHFDPTEPEPIPEDDFAQNWGA